VESFSLGVRRNRSLTDLEPNSHRPARRGRPVFGAASAHGQGAAMPSDPARFRVLYILQNLPVPFDRRAWLQATTLAANGYDVSMICPKGRGFTRSHERLEGVDIHRYPLPIEGHGKLGFIVEFVWCFCATFLLSLRVGLFGRGFDILHICNPPETYWPMAWFWRAFGKVFIFDHRDLSPELAEAKWGRRDGAIVRGLLFLERMTFRAANLVIACNESYKEIAIERGGKRPDDIFVVRSGPQVSRFRLYPPDPARRRGKPHLIVYLGEMSEQDGVEYLVRAVKELRDEMGRDDFCCTLIGGGPHQPSVAAFAAAEGVGDLCHFAGIVSDDELFQILSSADVAVDPLPKNDFSDRSTMNKILEYMFFGLPIVAFDLKEARVSAEQAGLFVAANDVHAMAGGIAALLDDPVRRREMGEFGRARLCGAVAFDYQIPHLLACYDAARALRRRRGPCRRSGYSAG
jgi:glycosyltransferase involved in cell wall biosynthesis